MAGDVVVGIGRNASLTALDLSTGTARWTHRGGLDGWVGADAQGGRVFTGGGDGELVALDLGSGALLWSTEVGAQPTSWPVAAGETVAILTDHGISAFAPDTGDVLWTEALGSAAEHFTLSSGLSSDGERIFVAADSLDPALRALKTTDGSTEWAVGPGGRDHVGPFLGGGTLVMAATCNDSYPCVGSAMTGPHSQLQAFAPESGTPRWTQEYPGTVSNLVLSDTLVVFLHNEEVEDGIGDTGGPAIRQVYELLALSLADGREQWRVGDLDRERPLAGVGDMLFLERRTEGGARSVQARSLEDGTSSDDYSIDLVGLEGETSIEDFGGVAVHDGGLIVTVTYQVGDGTAFPTYTTAFR